MTTLIVGWDSDIDEFGWRVSVTERDDGNVDVGGLLDGLGVGTRVGDDDQARLLERAGDVICEVTGSEATCDGNGASVGCELQDSALTVRACGNDTDIGRVVDCGDDAGCQDDFLPARMSNLAFAKAIPCKLTRSCQC